MKMATKSVACKGVQRLKCSVFFLNGKKINQTFKPSYYSDHRIPQPAI